MTSRPMFARIYLPKLTPAPATALEFLCGHFGHVAPEIWRERMDRGEVTTDAGRLISPDTPYQHGLTIFYRREVRDEPILPFRESIIFQDEHLLVADKPHFLPVTPSGSVVNECLLARLQRSTGIGELAPIHRLDRDTAGLVLFSTRSQDRALYADLFARGTVQRRYLAVARLKSDEGLAETLWRVEDRLAAEPGSLRMRSVPGEANALTEIRLLERDGTLGSFELLPATGKKHQLRIHMMSLGFPILNDPFYPSLRMERQDVTRPMQLLAAGISFRDPVTQHMREFVSGLRLEGSFRNSSV